MELLLIHTLQCIHQVACTPILQCLRYCHTPRYYLVSMDMYLKTWLLIISSFVLYQEGSYPYSPYAMHSPNGMTVASVSSSHFSSNSTCLLFFCCCWIINETHACMQGNTTGGTEGDSKRSDVKEKLPIRRSKRILNMMRGKNSGASANNGANSKRHVTFLDCSVLIVFGLTLAS